MGLGCLLAALDTIAGHERCVFPARMACQIEVDEPSSERFADVG